MISRVAVVKCDQREISALKSGISCHRNQWLQGIARHGRPGFSATLGWVQAFAHRRGMGDVAPQENEPNRNLIIVSATLLSRSNCPPTSVTLLRQRRRDPNTTLARVLWRQTVPRAGSRWRWQRKCDSNGLHQDDIDKLSNARNTTGCSTVARKNNNFNPYRKQEWISPEANQALGMEGMHRMAYRWRRVSEEDKDIEKEKEEEKGELNEA